MGNLVAQTLRYIILTEKMMLALKMPFLSAITAMLKSIEKRLWEADIDLKSLGKEETKSMMNTP